MADTHVQFGEEAIQRTKTNQSAFGAFKRRISVHETDTVSISETGGNVRESDYRKRQVRRCSEASGHSAGAMSVTQVKLIQL